LNYAIILAAGTGSRLGVEHTPKQYLRIGEKPLLMYVLETFDDVEEIDELIIVAQPDFFSLIEDIIHQFSLNKPYQLVNGALTRQGSSFQALKYLSNKAKDDDNIIIHDSARVLVSRKIITNGLSALKNYKAVMTALPAVDSLISTLDHQQVDAFVDRRLIYQVQTPQFFKFCSLFEAHNQALLDHIEDASDDTSLLIRLGCDIGIIKGSAYNFKVTTMDDFIMLSKIIGEEKITI
jgi:D-ribitol-5-phosphate cytidylyltransferase